MVPVDTSGTAESDFWASESGSGNVMGLVPDEVRIFGERQRRIS
jgi:hypothetical protein